MGPAAIHILPAACRTRSDRAHTALTTTEGDTMKISDADAMTFELGWLQFEEGDTVPEGYTVEDAARDEALAAHAEVHRLQAELAAAIVRRQDAVIALRDRHGWSHQLVADLLEVSRGTAQGYAERRTTAASRRAGG